MSCNKKEQACNEQRRTFLKKGIAFTGGATVASGVLLYGVGHARPTDEPVTDFVRWGMLVDTNRCAEGCTACVDACNKEHGLEGTGRAKTDAQWIRKLTIRDKKTQYKKSFPVMCQHCENPPCVDVCPTGASFRRADGIVLVDKHTCIGCRYCMMACPYKARSFIHEMLSEQLPHAPRGKGTVESCTFCVHKLDRNEGTTACVQACTKAGHNALVFGDLNDPKSEISQRLAKQGGTQIRADLNLNLGVRYQGI
ncbi:MAG: sulfate reduction electron transfer complex DsrMKJOP subunit DsrO [Candidatus Oxydemutatoraceae bacterium WSBS_2016_MAG_OTU14]